ncbi:MAG TPA: DUF4388 domain-containing protein [Fibrobacteria bacterium]|nr:DUF4388 domain-containing protein [Fibrobacteria bacterium]
MAEAEDAWALKALELDNCPFYSKGDILQVRMPGVYGSRVQVCSMPVASFIPLTMRSAQSEGSFESGYKACACRWGYCRANGIQSQGGQIEEVLAAENQSALPFLKQLPPMVQAAFKDRAKVMTFRSGEVVQEGQVQSPYFHVIVKGVIRIHTKGADGRVMEPSMLRKGDCFGEMSILTGSAISSQCDAVEDCLTLAVPRADFHRLIAEYPVISIILYRILSKRIQAINLKVAQLLSPGLSGDLRYFALVDLMQSVLGARLTGTLRVERDGRRARFGFLEGRLVHGSMGNTQGTEALDEALRWTTGSFRFSVEGPLPPANLEGDTMALLLGPLHRMDESLVLERGPDGLNAAG